MLTIETVGLDQAARMIDELAGLPRSTDFWESIGELLVDQARARIEVQKADPDGVPWRPWDPNYARGRVAGSLLFDSGELLRSIESYPDRDLIEVGPDVLHGIAHQKTRPFLGLGDHGRDELEAHAVELFEAVAG